MRGTDLDADEQSEQESSRHLCKVLDGSDAPVEQDLVRNLDDDTPHDEKDDRGLGGSEHGRFSALDETRSAGRVGTDQDAFGEEVEVRKKEADGEEDGEGGEDA